MLSDVSQDEARRRAESAVRAAARAAWPIRGYALGEEPDEDLSSTTTAAERVAMVWPLSRAAFSLGGHELPSYSRDQMPGRVIRGGQK